ncbi:MAG: ATP-binding cassette domain-containing protein [Oscillospiraceae bacterium]|nr:ATP-binding cassette domain-containing protein [Oscillospiraceae bacterium]
MNEEKKVLLSLKNVEVKFNVRGRILTAIRNVSLDIYENESLAIVGESGSGKSVLTKTFAGMLDSNGFIPQGSIILSDDELAKTDVQLTARNEKLFEKAWDMLNKHSVNERGAAEYMAIVRKKEEIEHRQSLSQDEEADFAARIKSASDDVVDKTNYLWTLDRKADAAEVAKVEAEIKELTARRDALEKEKNDLAKKRAAAYKNDTARANFDQAEIQRLEETRRRKIETPRDANNPYGVDNATLERNKIIAYEIVLSIARFPARVQAKNLRKLEKAFNVAMTTGEDLNDETLRNRLFEEVGFRVAYRSFDESTRTIHGYGIIDCAKIKYANDWQQIRGRRIATVFQDPMTSLNPVITIGKQIMTVIQKHQKCSNAEARERTLDIMAKVGIPDPEKRFDDYPFEYSGGMRQRIVIAIALSCQPKILICDEPTTALDVTIQAQIIRLIKDLQHKLGFTTVYITHDLGVVANVAERVAVLYGGQIVEIGTVEEIFYDPRHPYTWALLSSMPQLCEKGGDLFSIPGTPPSLYNKIVGDAFAPRNQYAMAIDLVEEPPMFQVSPTHFAKTWLLDPRAPKTEAPANIRNLHEKILKTYVSFDEEAANG